MKKLFYLIFLLSPLVLSGCGDDGTAQAKEDVDKVVTQEGLSDNKKDGSIENPSTPNSVAPPDPCPVQAPSFYDSGTRFSCFNGEQEFQFQLFKGKDVKESKYCCELYIVQMGETGLQLEEPERVWNSEQGYNNCDTRVKEMLDNENGIYHWVMSSCSQ